MPQIEHPPWLMGFLGTPARATPHCNFCCDTARAGNASLPMEQHMPERGTVAFGVGSYSSQCPHVVMHLAWEDNITEVLLDSLTGLASTGTPLPKPAA